MAPPVTLSRSGSAPDVFSHAVGTDAKASLTSNRSISSIDMPAFFNARSVACSGASSMITGSPPIMVMWWIRAIGFTPSALRPLLIADRAARGAVADLAGAGGGQLAVLGDQLDVADALEAGIETDAFIDC